MSYEQFKMCLSLLDEVRELLYEFQFDIPDVIDPREEMIALLDDFRNIVFVGGF